VGRGASQVRDRGGLEARGARGLAAFLQWTARKETAWSWRNPWIKHVYMCFAHPFPLGSGRFGRGSLETCRIGPGGVIIYGPEGARLSGTCTRSLQQISPRLQPGQHPLDRATSGARHIVTPADARRLRGHRHHRGDRRHYQGDKHNYIADHFRGGGCVLHSSSGQGSETRALPRTLPPYGAPPRGVTHGVIEGGDACSRQALSRWARLRVCLWQFRFCTSQMKTLNCAWSSRVECY
jgi:hypothetical protein